MHKRFIRLGVLVPTAAVLAAVPAASAFAAGPTVTFPSTITVGHPFTFKVSNISTQTPYVFGGLDGEDNQPQGYSFGFTLAEGQPSMTITTTIPKTLTFGSTQVTTRGGPRAISIMAGSQTVYSGVVDLTGVPTDRQVDDQSPYHLSYNATTGKATISAIPQGANQVQIYYRQKGQPEQDNYILKSQSISSSGSSSLTMPVSDIPSKNGYLEAEFLLNNGQSADTNELPVSQGLPVGQAPEVPWAVGIPVVGLGTMAAMMWRKRKISVVK